MGDNLDSKDLGHLAHHLGSHSMSFFIKDESFGFDYMAIA